MEYCRFSYADARDLPVNYRKWFITRKQKELEKKKESQEKAKRNTPAKSR